MCFSCRHVVAAVQAMSRCRSAAVHYGVTVELTTSSEGPWRCTLMVLVLAAWVTSSVLRTCCVAAAAARSCQFPAFLQTNSSADGQWRDWRGQVPAGALFALLRLNSIGAVSP